MCVSAVVSDLFSWIYFAHYCTSQQIADSVGVMRSSDVVPAGHGLGDSARQISGAYNLFCL